jgi:lipid II isoglutaminyl synthase (glutamine-hydrolysing)
VSGSRSTIADLVASPARPAAPRAASTPSAGTRPATRSVAHRLARFGGRAATALSRAARLGEGSVVGGALAQRIDPHIADELAEGMRVVVVSGTNGKTTTTRLIADAMPERPPATNRTGANLANGVVGALIGRPDAGTAVLEIDEAVVPWALETLCPDVLVLLNLSRDQLDRMHEVSALADRWRAAIAQNPPRVVVANADDPLVVYAVGEANVSWVAAGLSWTTDAATCLWCGGVIEFSPMGWACGRCAHRRPPCTMALDGDAVEAGTWRSELGLAIPGRSVRANAVMALAAIEQLGLPLADAIESWSGIRSVEGRYEVSTYYNTEMRLHLAKNPAGWRDTLDVIGADALPVILVLNARSEDGRDPSWIWDVPFDQLRHRTVVCLGERSSDLAVRLAHADVNAREATSLRSAAAIVGPGSVHLIANYSAFQQSRATLARGR